MSEKSIFWTFFCNAWDSWWPIWQTWRICLYSGNLQLNSSTVDEVGSWCLKGWWSRATFLAQGRRYHRKPASDHHPGTVTLIQSVEYLPIPSTYPWEGQVGKNSSANIGKQSANVNDLKGQQASKKA